MEFIIGEYILKIRNHDNGVICIIYNNQYEINKVFGLDKYENNVYILKDFEWDCNNCKGAKGLIDSVNIYIKELIQIDLTETIVNLLIKICDDLYLSLIHI